MYHDINNDIHHGSDIYNKFIMYHDIDSDIYYEIIIKKIYIL